MTALETWLDELAYTDFPDELFVAGASIGTRAYAAEIEEMLAPDRGIGASAVFCVEEQPTVCFVDATTLGAAREERIEQIRQRVWNQNLVSVVLVLDNSTLSAYAVTNRDAEPEVLSAPKVGLSGRWSAYEFHSGFVKDRLSTWFAPDERVDQRLLLNLRQVVKKLVDGGLVDTQAEALMAQVIFLCYLEQRGIVGDTYRAAHDLNTLESYFNQRDGEGIDRLLSQLGADFNGDFLRSADGGAPLWSTLRKESFDPILDFLDAVDSETGQGSFWRYDFSHIPVELISGIYETLLKERQRKRGAYYTPRHLANLVADQAFEAFADPSSCTVYDGACGSGILLTTAFRKMLRHAEVRTGRRMRFSKRVELMQRTIFGNDIDETACWITAFSLYLSLLEGLEPLDISLLQSAETLKLPQLVGRGLNIQKGERLGDFFSPTNPFAGKERFDIFLCNPPWRETGEGEDPTWEYWANEQTPPYPIGRRQIASGFAYRATRCVKPGGVIALILPLNLVIGATKQSSSFRQRWLEDVCIERIINFGDVRRLLFPAAKHPCAVVRVRSRSKDECVIALGDEAVEYWTPKTDVSLALGRLALHAADQKILTAREIYEKPYALISSYWGEQRDLALLRRLRRLGTIGDVMTGRETPWVSAKGFHAPNQRNKDRSLGALEDLDLLTTKRLPDDHPIIGADAQLERVKDNYVVVASPGGANTRLYHGPRVLFPDGLSGTYAVRAVYTDVPFAFTSSIGAIGGPTVDANLIKLLCAYLRSPLASYLLIMTGYSVIGERPRIALEDVEAFPFCDPKNHPNPKTANTIISKVADITDRIAQTQEFHRSHAYEAAKQKLDKLVFDYFQLTTSERVLVENAVDVIATSIQPGDYSRISTPLLHRSENDEIDAYVKTLARELGDWRERDGGAGSLNISAFVDGPSGFFGAVRIQATRAKLDHAQVDSSAHAFKELLGDLHASLAAQAGRVGYDDLFKIPSVMVVAGDSFYIVKPLRRRFWMPRAALSDADRVVKTVHAAAWKRSYS